MAQPQLNDLETQAIAANQTLKAAGRSVLVARATAKAVRSEEFPQVFALPGVSSARQSGTRPTQPGSTTLAYQANTYSLPADATYLVDIWGSVRRQLESANALTQASVAQYENVLLTLKADVAEDYIMVRYIDQEMVILQNNIDLQQQALQLAQNRRAGGVASGLDVSEAETQLDTTEASYIGLGVQRTQFEHALAVLVGKPPAEFSVPSAPIDLMPPALPPGVPSDLVERRPDVAAAERAMASRQRAGRRGARGVLPDTLAQRQRRSADRKSRQAAECAESDLGGGREFRRAALHRRIALRQSGQGPREQR